MGAATQVTTLADLRRDFLFRVRETTSVTDTNNAADRFLNIALHDIHVAPGNYVPWAIRRNYLETHDDYTTGTVSITVASSRTAVTGSGTAWNTAVAGMGFANARVGGKMRFGGDTDVYLVSAVGSDTSITLAHRYVGDSNLSGESYTYFEDEYALESDFFRPVDLRSFSKEFNIPLIGPQEFRRRYPGNYTIGRPSVATIIQLDFSGNTTPRYRVVFNPPPDDIYVVPYEYITSNLAVTTGGSEQAQLVNDTDEPIVPLRYRHLIVLNALYHWYRDRKDDTRSQEARAEYNELMQRVQSDTVAGSVHDRPQFRPRSYFGRGSYGAPSGRRFSTGNEFETFRNW
jgi:hypothetical protein